MNPASTVDLHLHSTASDGMLDPAALVAHVAACGVTLMALTDHDTVAGVDVAAAAAREHAIGFVAGVEISCAWRGKAIHVLGLAIDPANAALARGLAAQQRVARGACATRSRRNSTAAGAPGSGALAACARPAACRPARILPARWSPKARPATSAPPSTAGSDAGNPAT